MQKNHRPIVRCALPVASLALLIGLAGPVACQSPLEGAASDEEFRSAIDAAIAREMRDVGDPGTELKTESPPSPVEEALSERRDELERISPATPDNRTPFSLGADLAGDEQDVIPIGLQEAILAAVDQNLDIRRARLRPAIAREELIQAQAVFDFVLFAEAGASIIDEPTTVPVINSVPLGSPFNSSKTYRFETGVRKDFRTGGRLTLSTEASRFDNRAPGIDFSPDPAYEAALALGFVQPLLQGFGEDVNTAEIRFAENAQAREVEQLRSDLLDLVENVESAYWRLQVAWANIEITQWLVDVGGEVRDKLESRRSFDATLAEFADAVATVETRRANVIRARRQLRAASDNLKALLNLPDVGVASEAVLKPTEPLESSPITYNLRETLLMALEHRPELRTALLTIDDAAINEVVAENRLLPLLNVSAEVRYMGLDDSLDEAYGGVFEDDFINYVFGLTFEQAIGNRADEAALRAARLQRTQALLGYQLAIQQVVLDVKAALRDVVANYQLIEATRSSRVAQAENLRALQVTEESIASLTPEFLNLKFQRQEGLARARQAEIQAQADFDRSIAALHRAMGVGLTMNNIAFQEFIDPADDEHPLISPDDRDLSYAENR